MKKFGIDFKSIIIGVLFGITVVMFLGAKATKDGVFDTITVKKIKVTNEEGKERISLGSSKDEGWVILKNKEGNPVVEISSIGTSGEISIFNKKELAIFLGGHKDAVIVVCNEKGNSVIGMRSFLDMGQFVILDRNSSDWKVLMQQNQEGDGEIFIYDKNNQLFWSKSPEKQENSLNRQ